MFLHLKPRVVKLEVYSSFWMIILTFLLLFSYVSQFGHNDINGNLSFILLIFYYYFFELWLNFIWCGRNKTWPLGRSFSLIKMFSLICLLDRSAFIRNFHLKGSMFDWCVEWWYHGGELHKYWNHGGVIQWRKHGRAMFDANTIGPPNDQTNGGHT